jgi:hypothetical protein
MVQPDLHVRVRPKAVALISPGFGAFDLMDRIHRQRKAPFRDRVREDRTQEADFTDHRFGRDFLQALVTPDAQCGGDVGCQVKDDPRLPKERVDAVRLEFAALFVGTDFVTVADKNICNRDLA